MEGPINLVHPNHFSDALVASRGHAALLLMMQHAPTAADLADVLVLLRRALLMRPGQLRLAEVDGLFGQASVVLRARASKQPELFNKRVVFALYCLALDVDADTGDAHVDPERGDDGAAGRAPDATIEGVGR